MTNYNCDGSGPHTDGEVRVLPYPGGNLILCKSCLRHELAYRRTRNLELSENAKFDIPTFESLAVYPTKVS